LRHRRWLTLTLVLALFTAGCGGGGGGGGTPSGGGGGGGGGGGDTGTVTYRVPAFGGAQVATAVVGYQPAKTSAADAEITLQATNRLARSLDQGDREADPELSSAGQELALSRDMPAEVRAVEDELRARVTPRLRSEGPRLDLVRARYSDIPEGDTTTFYIATTGRTVTVQKMHDSAETTSTLVFAEVVDGLPVLSKEKALEIDERFGLLNPYDPTGMGIGPRVRSIFGSEWSTGGGRDGETKIIFVLLSSEGIGGANLYGFFRPNDAFSKVQIPTSNEGEILYMNANHFNGDMFDGLATVAHEFQHMCNFNQKYLHEGAFNGTDEDDTINEGQSVLAEEKTGFGLIAPGGGNSFLFIAARGYLQAPHNYAFFTFDNYNADYGKGYLLMKYIHDRFGVDTIHRISTSRAVGRNNIANQTGIPFGTLFQDWALANLLDPVSGAPAKYTYAGLNLDANYNIRDLGNVNLPAAKPARTASPPTAKDTLTLKPWVNLYSRYSGGNGSPLDLTLTLGTSADVSATNLVVESPAKGTFGSLQ
jgi:hypothetical protein